MNNSELSRRQLLVRTAATATGLSLSMSILAARRASAEIKPTPNPTEDNMKLNALLAAEYDAVATYTAGATVIAGDTTADQATKDTVTKVAVHFQNQHKQHAAALKALIEKNGGTAVADAMTASIPDSFKNATPPPDTIAVLKLAEDKERAAAFTYAQVIQSISTPAAAQLVAAIGGVETQHFVVLYLLINGYIKANAKTNTSADLVVPADFVIDVGLAGSLSLDNFAALDQALAYDPKPA